MAFFPTDTGGFFDGMNIFGAKMPTYLGGADGLLSTTEQEKLKNQALISGILGAGATYLAQPKNQGYGSALPYLAKSYLGGMTQSQGAYDQATQINLGSPVAGLGLIISATLPNSPLATNAFNVGLF